MEFRTPSTELWQIDSPASAAAFVESLALPKANGLIALLLDNGCRLADCPRIEAEPSSGPFNAQELFEAAARRCEGLRTCRAVG